MAKNPNLNPKSLNIKIEGVLIFGKHHIKWQMTLKSSTMVGENFENYLSEVAKMQLKSSTVVGENFENYLSEVAKMHLNHPPWLEKI